MKTWPDIPITQEFLRANHDKCVERLRCKVCGLLPALRVFDAKDYGKRRFPKNAACPCCEHMVPPETFADMRYKWRASRFRAAMRYAMTRQYTGGKS